MEDLFKLLKIFKNKQEDPTFESKSKDYKEAFEEAIEIIKIFIGDVAQRERISSRNIDNFIRTITLKNGITIVNPSGVDDDHDIFYEITYPNGDYTKVLKSQTLQNIITTYGNNSSNEKK